MKHLTWLIGLAAIFTLSACSEAQKVDENLVVLTKVNDNPLTYILPSPKLDGKMSVEQALYQRRSHRHFQADKPLTAEQLSQILWSAYGITLPREDRPDAPPNRPSFRGGMRTAPSAGATFPFEIYAVVGNVIGIEPGVYRYISEKHTLVRVIDHDVREDLRKAALGQMMVEHAPATIFWSAIFSRSEVRYGSRGRERYVCMDLGHSGQNVYLQAEAMGLGTCAIGAFTDADVIRVMQLPPEEEPLYMMPVGYIQPRQ